MQIQEGNLYRHISTIDVDLFVIKVIEETEEGYVALAYYMYKNSGMLVSDTPDMVVIKKSELSKWSKL